MLSPQYSCQWKGWPKHEKAFYYTLVSGKVGPNMRRLSTAGEIQPLNKKNVWQNPLQIKKIIIIIKKKKVVKLVWKAYNSHASLKQKEHFISSK